MKSNSTKVEMMKPVFFKAGIPIAITFAGYVIAKITTRKTSFSLPSSNPHDDSSASPVEAFLFNDKHKYEEDLQSLRRQTHDIEEREHQLKAKFQHYRQLKDEEIALLDMQNKLVLEINKIDFLCKEITLVEAESQRFQNMVVEYLGIMEILDKLQSENKLLHKRIKKLLKNIKEQKIQLEAKETEISRNSQVLEMKDQMIKKMEKEIQQLRLAIEQLQDERVSAENSNPSKEDVTEKDYKEVGNEVEQVENDKAREDKESIYLRWCNAGLRHELMRRNQEHAENNQEVKFGKIVVAPENELIMRRSSSVGHNESCLSSPIGGHSKRKKIIQKFKKWVEGSDKTKHETKCFKSHSKDLIVEARKSCSSA